MGNLLNGDYKSLNAEEFLQLLNNEKGDLSGIRYIVSGDILLRGEFEYGINLGEGVFENNFMVSANAIIPHLHFQEAEFFVEPRISSYATIYDYDDDDYFSSLSNSALEQEGWLIPSYRR